MLICFDLTPGLNIKKSEQFLFLYMINNLQNIIFKMNLTSSAFISINMFFSMNDNTVLTFLSVKYTFSYNFDY